MVKSKILWNEVKYLFKIIEWQNEGLPEPVFIILFLSPFYLPLWERIKVRGNKNEEKYLFAIRINTHRGIITGFQRLYLFIPEIGSHFNKEESRNIYAHLEMKYTNLYLITIDFKYPFNIEIIPDLHYNKKIFEKLNLFDLLWKIRKK